MLSKTKAVRKKLDLTIYNRKWKEKLAKTLIPHQLDKLRKKKKNVSQINKTITSVLLVTI